MLFFFLTAARKLLRSLPVSISFVLFSLTFAVFTSVHSPFRLVVWRLSLLPTTGNTHLHAHAHALWVGCRNRIHLPLCETFGIARTSEHSTTRAYCALTCPLSSPF